MYMSLAMEIELERLWNGSLLKMPGGLMDGLKKVSEGRR